MPSRRFHTTLVYFGLANDEALDAKLRQAPLNAWRVGAVVLAGALGLILATAILNVLGLL